jgi:hypothetical protein
MPTTMRAGAASPRIRSLVWEERDDPNLLRHAQRAKDVGRNPHVIDYRPDFGPSASYYAWEAAGRPVHGIKAA